jgi:thymidylate synthase
MGKDCRKLMKHTHINAVTIPDSWFQLLYTVLDEGKEYKIERGSFAGHNRLEFGSVSVQIDLPGIAPLIPEFPSWLDAPPPVTQDYLDNYFQQLMSTDKPENCDYVYGMYLRPQIDKIIEILKETPLNNQCCATIGDMYSIDMNDPPCMRIAHFNIRDKRLNMFLFFRSNDLWSGYPCNIAGMQLVKEYMAGEIGVQDGQIFYYSSGLHLYDYQYDLARLRTMR